MEGNHPQHISSFSLGANTSDDKEIVGGKEASGEYIIGRNQRPISVDGNTGASSKIKGEELRYDKLVAGNYICIGTCTVNDHLVEIFASRSGEPSFIRIDGVTVLKSPLFGATWNHPFQIDVNNDTKGGEMFITDFNVEPMIFNIQDLLDSLTAAPTKYFAAYDPKLYSVNISSPLDIPVFVETVNVGGGGGLPPGSYSYQIRYSTKDGDRTNLSQRTPLIPIVQNQSLESAQYPGSKTYGQDPSPTFGTRYGIKLRFRVTNLQNFDFIEVVRTAFNTNGGIGFTPAPTVVAKIDIFNGEISVRDFIDPVDTNTTEVISDVELTQEITYVNRAKGIRYFDRRVNLMNVELASRTSDLTFRKFNGKEMFPVIENLGPQGFKDPYNFVYKKHSMHGERIGYGVNLYDGVGGKGFTTKVPGFEDYQMPNRREEISFETDLYSYFGVVSTTNIFNAVTKTHEVFDHYRAIQKTDKCSFKNILHNKTASSVFGTKSAGDVTEDCSETNGEIENHGAEVSLLGRVSPYYHPYTPTRQNDSNVDGHNYLVNTQVCEDSLLFLGSPAPGSTEDYHPRIFSPTYYSQGMALAGVENLPPWAKSFSVVRTEPAGRVVAQGIGMYALSPADYNKIGTNNSLATKDKDSFWFFSPDIENGIVSGRLIDDIVDAPENYEVQFVSPLGFASEMYSFDNNNLSVRDRNIDIIAYARMMRDNLNNASSGEINPMEDSGMGFVDGSHNYVGYGKWRNAATPSLFVSGDKGNNSFGLIQATRIKEGRGSYMRLRMNAELYASGSTGGGSDAGFEDAGMKDFTEPFYMVNIIRTGATVRDQNIENYRITSHYQKLESIIGVSNGAAGQRFVLVDERWEDVISAPFPTHPNASIPRYAYVRRLDGVVEKWLNVTFLSASDISTIASDIASLGEYSGTLGSGVNGMYRHDITNLRSPELIFDVSGFTPDANELILVRYDNTAPIRFWGGDSVIGESIFSPIDREADPDEISGGGLDKAPDNQFAFGIGFPYRLMKMNPRVFQVKRTTGGNEVQDANWGYLGYIRQMCIMFTAESRIALPYAHGNGYPLDFFPSVHYVMRPHRWKADDTVTENNIYPQYEEDYGTEEKNNWKWGGFRFTQTLNPDYSALPPKEFVSEPKFGFEENTHFPTRVMASLPRQINQQNSPGLKTFPANNAFDIDDRQGEIKLAWSATTDKGDNLYAFTNSGICLLLTKKSILSDLNGGEIAYMASDSFIKGQYWLNKEVGMTDEMWRSAAEGYVPVKLGDGSEARVEAVFFANHESAFRLMDNQLKDIGRIEYHNTLYKEVLAKIGPGYGTHVCATFDKYHQEYLLHVNTNYNEVQPPELSVNRTEVFGQKNSRWYGYFDYEFDKFLVHKNKTYGSRDEKLYELGIGYQLNGENIVYEITGASSPKQPIDKEFMWIKINTGEEVKPTAVEFYNKYQGPVIGRMDASLGPLYLKKYRGWEGGIPRMLASYNPQRNRIQGRVVIWKVIHDLPEDFRIIDVAIQYKDIK